MPWLVDTSASKPCAMSPVAVTVVLPYLVGSGTAVTVSAPGPETMTGGVASGLAPAEPESVPEVKESALSRADPAGPEPAAW
jgi:hypothetical protein